MKLKCPICRREITATINGSLLRHGFKRGKQTFNGVRVDGPPCKGSGHTGLRIMTDKAFDELVKFYEDEYGDV